MNIPTSLADLVQGAPPHILERISSRWGTEPESLHVGIPDDSLVYRLIDELGREERWTLFDVLELSGRAEANRYPGRSGSDGTRAELDLQQLRERGLIFVVAYGPELARYFVIPDELTGAMRRYREQLLVMKLDALRLELAEQSIPCEPIELPYFVRPHVALSYLFATGDPEGFRYPLSRALAIPETFRASVKPILRAMLHEFYLLLLPYLGTLDEDQAYPIEGMVTLCTGVGALLGHHHSAALDPLMCDEEERPFAFANAQLSGARRAFWRSFSVLFIEGLLAPVGAACPLDDDRFRVHPPAFHRLDLEVQRPRWVVHCLDEWGIEVSPEPA